MKKDDADNQQPSQDEDFIFCQECLKLDIERKFSRIVSQHLKKYHNITVAEYKLRYPDALLERTGTQLRRELSLQRHFGVRHPIKVPHARKVIEATSISRYGVPHPSMSLEVQEKIKQTCLKKYGVENVAPLDWVQKKTKQTYLEKYGVEHPMKDPYIAIRNANIQRCAGSYEQAQLSRRATFRRKYDVDHPMILEHFKAKRRFTLLNRYGKDNASKVEQFKSKRVRTYLKKYGVSNPMKIPSFREKQRRSCYGRLSYLPTEPELKIIDLKVDGVVYVGDFKIWLTFPNGTVKCPDFLCFPKNYLDTTIKVIEYFGAYWHDIEITGVSREEHERQTVEQYRSINVQCLIIWDTDLEDTSIALQKIENFVLKGSTTKDYRSDSIIEC